MNNEKTYQICTRCVMDTSDPEITFDQDGVCNHCTDLLTRRKALGDENAKKNKLDALVESVKKAGKGKDYDCIVGVSGGIDSTFIALRCKDLGLRPLALHFDNGWNSELAVNNIENAIKKLGIDLYTHVMDWGVFRSLHLAFLRAGTPDIEAPTDHGQRACGLKIAAKNGIRHILIGNNLSTEGILPRSWAYGNSDWRYIRSVHRRFLGESLQGYPHYSLFGMAYNTLIRRTERVQILDLLSYNKQNALDELKSRLGYREYPGKHYESIFTRFFQGYILPKRFGYDKRRAHMSVLILSGELQRDEALQQLKSPPYDQALIKEDEIYVRKKLGLDDKEWSRIMEQPLRTSDDYPNSKGIHRKLSRLYKLIQ
ncbi:N-acetyl sugar amidotransferase [Verrucomicrobia bacterium]|nr:N-acetyl sugar amidotransferase [Verrucomicrobiota bacterium]